MCASYDGEEPSPMWEMYEQWESISWSVASLPGSSSGVQVFRVDV